MYSIPAFMVAACIFTLALVATQSGLEGIVSALLTSPK